MFSITPAFDMLMPAEDINDLFSNFPAANNDIDSERAYFYRLAEERGVSITVIKTHVGSCLLDAAKSTFGVTMSPVHCIEYCLTHLCDGIGAGRLQ